MMVVQAYNCVLFCYYKKKKKQKHAVDPSAELLLLVLPEKL